MVHTCPVRAWATSAILSIPRHSVASRNNVLSSAPPSMHAKQPRSRSTVASQPFHSERRSHQQPVEPSNRAQQKVLLTRHNKKTTIHQPVNTKRQTELSSNIDLTFAICIDCDNFLSPPIRKPKTAIMPTWRLAHRQAGHQSFQFELWSDL